MDKELLEDVINPYENRITEDDELSNAYGKFNVICFEEDGTSVHNTTLVIR